MTRMVDCTTTKLGEAQAKKPASIMEFIASHESNSDDNLVDDPSIWNIRDFHKWKGKGKPRNNIILPPNTGTGTTSTTISLISKVHKDDNNRLQN